MNHKSILRRIIKEEGSCNWVSDYVGVCNNCPLSKLKQKDNGDNYSCVEAVGAMDMTDKDADAIYKTTANNELASIEAEEILLGINEDDTTDIGYKLTMFGVLKALF